MICLGIETTAHTFGIGIIDNKGNILANQRDMFTTDEGGMVPHDVAEHHIEVCTKIMNKALKEANLTIKDIDLISFSQGPGMGHMLRIGTFFARALNVTHNIPIIGINHCIAHLEIGNILTGSKDPVLLYVSGANTQIIAYEANKYRIFGETLDTGIGNFLDTFARSIDLGFPGGPKIEQLAKKSTNLVKIPYIVKGMDLAVGGLLTKAKQLYKKGETKEDLCYSIQETVFAMLVEVAERAMAHTGKTELLLGGGVACNKRLQEMCKIMCKERGAKFFVPPKQVLIDNGLMIAWQGILEYKSDKRQTIEDTTIKPYWRTDQVKVTWKK